MNKNESLTNGLLERFFHSCEHHFRYLEQSCGYNYISGILEYRDNYKVIKSFKNQQIRNDFLAITRYERGLQAIEIIYGEEHFFLEGYVYYDRIRRFELSEVLAAAKKNDVSIAGEWGLSSPDMLEKSVQRIAESLKNNVSYYIRRDERLLQRAEAIRNHRIEQSVRKHFDKHIVEACTQAAKAFVHKDYTMVISILQPLEHYLASGDLKKLRLAEKYLVSLG
ncbi:MAG: hypothetical protein KTR28_01865 [Micavibrio sp.]|nr:hypothetical protein [Micavibrio sp.]